MSSVRTRSAASHADTSIPDDELDEFDDDDAHGSPTEPPNHGPATLHLRAAVDAYAAGLTDVGAREIGNAWDLVIPAVRITIARIVREPHLRDDAEQGAFLKLWQAVQHWNPENGPPRNADATAKWMASKAALNVVEKRDRDADREQQALDDEVVRDAVEYRASSFTGPGLDDAKTLADFARLVHDRAPDPAKGKLWAAIVLAAGDGLELRDDIADDVNRRLGLNLAAVDIRREAFRMVRALPHPRDAINKLEVLVYDVVDDTASLGTMDEPSALFHSEWQEIA